MSVDTKKITPVINKQVMPTWARMTRQGHCLTWLGDITLHCLEIFAYSVMLRGIMWSYILRGAIALEFSGEGGRYRGFCKVNENSETDIIGGWLVLLVYKAAGSEIILIGGGIE